MSHVVYDAVWGATSLRQIKGCQFTPQNRVFKHRRAGATAVDAIGIEAASPRFSGRTGDLGTLAAAGLNGIYVTGGTITLPWNKRALGGAFTSNGAFVASGTGGLLLPTEYRASQGDEAGAEVEFAANLMSSDGMTAPMTAAINQSTAAAAFVAAYELGPVSLGGVQITEITGVRVRPGRQAIVEFADGDNYAKRTYIDTENIEPTIELMCTNLDALQPWAALFGTFASCAVHFRRRLDGGTTVSDVTAQHVRFTGAGLVDVQEFSGEETRTARASIVLHVKDLAVNAAAAVAL